jgi:hypothetical protein
MSIRNQLAKVVMWMKKGMKLTISERGTYFHYNDDGKCLGRACAVGAILVGQDPNREDLWGGIDYMDNPVGQVNELVPDLFLLCPINHKRKDSWQCMPDDAPMQVGSLAEHLFENHKWSRNRIASWLEEKVEEFDRKKQEKQAKKSLIPMPVFKVKEKVVR